MADRIQTPWSVRVFIGTMGSSTNGYTRRYFETREQAVTFVGHRNAKLVTSRPGEAWIHASHSRKGRIEDSANTTEHQSAYNDPPHQA